jgi:DeoR/GlpR family transcriptional regulator of sugar metabolism
MRYERSLAIAKRHDKLIDLIRTGDFSSSVLARKLKVSEQTIYRDIDFLRKRGYSIRSEKLSDGWAYRILSEPEAVSSRREGPGK